MKAKKKINLTDYKIMIMIFLLFCLLYLLHDFRCTLLKIYFIFYFYVLSNIGKL